MTELRTLLKNAALLGCTLHPKCPGVLAHGLSGAASAYHGTSKGTTKAIVAAGSLAVVLLWLSKNRE